MIDFKTPSLMFLLVLGKSSCCMAIFVSEIVCFVWRISITDSQILPFQTCMKGRMSDLAVGANWDVNCDPYILLVVNTFVVSQPCCMSFTKISSLPWFAIFPGMMYSNLLPWGMNSF